MTKNSEAASDRQQNGPPSTSSSSVLVSRICCLVPSILSWRGPVSEPPKLHLLIPAVVAESVLALLLIIDNICKRLEATSCTLTSWAAWSGVRHISLVELVLALQPCQPWVAAGAQPVCAPHRCLTGVASVNKKDNFYSPYFQSIILNFFTLSFKVNQQYGFNKGTYNLGLS